MTGVPPRLTERDDRTGRPYEAALGTNVSNPLLARSRPSLVYVVNMSHRHAVARSPASRQQCPGVWIANSVWRPEPMKTRRSMFSTILVAALAASVTAACGGGDGDAGTESSQSAGPAFSTNATGDLAAWGFDNADEVGTSRLDYAKQQLSRSDDQDRRHPVRRAEVHHPGRQWRCARRRADGPPVRRHVRGQGSDQAARRLLHRSRGGSQDAVLPVGDRRRHLRRQGLGRAAVLPAAGDHAEQAGDGQGRRHRRRHRHLQAGACCSPPSPRCTRPTAATPRPSGWTRSRPARPVCGCSVPAGS